MKYFKYFFLHQYQQIVRFLYCKSISKNLQINTFYIPMILTRTYREQNQSIIEILRLIYSQEAKKARKLLANINMQYSTELNHVISLGTYNQTLNQKIEELQKQVDELTTDLKKAIRDKEQTKQKSRIKMGQNTSDAAKVKIFNLLENDDFNETQKIVKSQKFEKFGKIVQQAWEYRWILSKYDQLTINGKSKSSINKFKELTFQKDRKWLQTLILKTATTTVDINNQFAKILQAIETNGKVIIDTEKPLIQPININFLLRINQKQQMLKLQLMRRCNDLSEIQNRIKQVNRSFGKTDTKTDDSCAEMVYKLATDYEQLRYDSEQQNPSNRLERKKSVEQKIGLIEFKYWFDWFMSIIQINKLVPVNISKHLSEKETYRQKFQCIRQIIFKAIQSKQQGMMSREQEMGDRIQNAKIQLQSFNQNVVMSLQSLEKVGGALLELGKISLQESVRILGNNINIILNELKYHRQQHLLLSEYKNKSITEKWQQQNQMEKFNLQSQKSQGYQENAIEIRLRIEMSELKILHELLKESSIKKISEKQAQITELKNRIEDLKKDIVTETDAKKLKQKQMGQLRSKIMPLQKTIFESQIRDSIDFNVDQSELKIKLEELTLEHQNLKKQIKEKDQWFADLKNQTNLKLKSAEDKYELKIEEWRQKYKQYQQDTNLNNQKLKSQIQEKDKSIVDLKNRMKAKLKSVQDKCEVKIEEWRQKCKQYQADLLQSYNNIQMIIENQQEMMQFGRGNLQQSRKSYDGNYKKQYETQIQKNSELQRQIDQMRQFNNNHKIPELIQKGIGSSQVLEGPPKSKIQVQKSNSFKKENNMSPPKSQMFKEIPLSSSQIMVRQSNQILHSKVLELQQDIRQLLTQKQNLLKHHQELIKEKDKQLEQIKKNVEKLEKQKEQLKKKCVKLVADNENGKPENANKLHLFTPCPGSIFLEQDYHQRLFLLEQLTNYLGQIKYTQLLYKTDIYNKINFHKYIDGHRHLIVIAKTIYGKIFAGYTQQAFSSTGIKKGRGIIFSLWGRKVFQFRQKRAITYDDFYMIFGNSEIRIKSLEMKVFSNFGISNGYYETRGQKVNALLGQDLQRQVDLSHYEVYSLGVQDM